MNPSSACPANLLQLFDPDSSTYTYIVWADESAAHDSGVEKSAIIIDPVDTMLDRDLRVLQEHGLTLKYILETHAHADHITSAQALASATSAQTAVPLDCGFLAGPIQLKDGDVLQFGNQTLRAIHTPDTLRAA